MKQLPFPDLSQAMTPAAFCRYARACYEAAAECIGEHEAQYLNEVAMFGDAGVGQAYHINFLKAELSGMASRYLELTGRELSRDAHPIYGMGEDIEAELELAECQLSFPDLFAV